MDAGPHPETPGKSSRPRPEWAQGPGEPGQEVLRAQRTEEGRVPSDVRACSWEEAQAPGTGGQPGFERPEGQLGVKTAGT